MANEPEINFDEYVDLEEEEVLEKLPIVPEPTEDDLLLPDKAPSKPLTVVERYICELYARGESPRKIATEMGIPYATVSRILAKPHIKEFVKELVNEQYTVIKEGRLRLLNRIIEDKLEALEREHGGDLSKATKKDVVDLIVTMDNMMKEREKAELGVTDDTYIAVIQQVVKD
jgi:hypothetical protein